MKADKILSFLLIPSSIAFFVLLSTRARYLVFLVGVGAVVGIALYYARAKCSVSGAKGIVKLILAAYLAYLASGTFFAAWQISPVAREILGVFTQDVDLILRALSFLFALASLPFLITVMDGIPLACKALNWKKLWKSADISMKSIVKSLAISCVVILAAAVLGLSLLVGVWQIPTENLFPNIQQSAFIIQKEGTIPELFQWCHSSLDNFTDSLMLLEASYESSDTPLQKALLAYHGVVGGGFPNAALISRFINGEAFSDYTAYARYWHGYLVFLRPLLQSMDYSSIRVLNGIVQLLLLTFICFLLAKRGLRPYIIPYIISYLMLMPVALAMSLQYSSCFYGMSIGAAALLLLPEQARRRYGWLVFTGIGIYVAFFDFLTYPIATFGVPAVLYTALQAGDSPENRISSIGKVGAAWCVGYAGMWSSKWILASLLTDFDIFSDAFGAVASRSAISAAGKYSFFACEAMNFETFFATPASFLFDAFVLCMILAILRKKEHIHRMSGIMIPYLILALAPFVWYAFALDHSTVHCFFTNKACVVSVIALMFALLECKTAADKSNRQSTQNASLNKSPEN